MLPRQVMRIGIALLLVTQHQLAHADASGSGLFLHAALGAGYRTDTISRKHNPGVADTPGDRTDLITGFGFALDLGVGWGVLPGFAVGVAVFLDWTSSPTLTEETWGDSKLSSARLTTIGPSVAWYPIRKALGWYLLGGVGVALFNYRNSPDNPFGIAGNARGVSFQLGTGYEFDLTTGVGLGAELRLLTTFLGESGDEPRISHVVTAPSLLASLTWF